MHFASDIPAARQQRFSFEPIYSDHRVLLALIELFANKCAFCESSLENQVLVHHFRPTQERCQG